MSLKSVMVFLLMASASLVGAQTIQTLCSFAGTNGANSVASLIQGNDGNFYGTTQSGGITNSTFPSGMGTIFKVTTNGTLTTLFLFSDTNGAYPTASLTLGNDGNFYGTTQRGGITNSDYLSGMGTVFEVATNGTLTTLVFFAITNGAYPTAGLTLGNDGNFYGTAKTIFQVTSNGILTTVASYSGTNFSNPYEDADPYAGLTLGNDGSFYGTTLQGGINNLGSVFKVTTNGTLTTLCSFSSFNGSEVIAGLTLGNDGNFYGTASYGGSNNFGTVFRVTTNGILTTLVSFANSNGAYPAASLTLGSDGNFYGTAHNGGTGYGTVFQVTTNGLLTTLVSFAGNNGAAPNAALTLGRDGNFYGTTYGGGDNNKGTVFRLSFPAAISLQPLSQTNAAGSTVTFTVVATTFFPVTYQWQKNGTNLFDGGNLSGANTNTLTITGISDSDSSSYSVIVSNSYGSVTSSIVTLTVIDPPIITSQPLSRTNNAGSTATFTVIAGGSTTPDYRWFKGSLPISGAVLATLTLANVQDADMAGYTVVLSNVAGSATSAPPATLTVIDPPSITAQPLSRTNNVGSTATFTVTANGTMPAYQWFKDSLPISGAVLTTLTLTNVQDTDVAGYTVGLTNVAGSATSAPPATLTVIDPPIITAQPSSLVVLPGTNVAFGVSLSGSAPYFRYQWQFNGTNLLNATNGLYTISGVATNKAGNYSVVVTNAAGRVVSSNAALSVVLSPKSQTNYASSTANFIVTAFGPESLNFQWQKNGTNLANVGNISGATNSTLIIANVQDADAAIYNAIVSDAANSVTTSNATLTVNDSLFIATQPLSQTVGVGSNVTFAATAYGAPPFIFQWYYNTNSPVGSPTSGTNSSSYTLTNVHTNQSGNYSVQVINGFGSLTSSNALLTVKVFPPTIGIQPTNQRVLIGGSASFVVSVSGTAPFVYHWRFNGTNILGATNAACTIPAVVATNTGNYSVVITNSAGGVTSSNAFLTVIVPPTMTLQLLAGYPVLNLNGMLSNNFTVQYNTDLTGTNWMPLQTFSNLLTSPYQFLDPAGMAAPARFYRVWMQ